MLFADAMETDDNPEDDGADFLLTDSGDDVDLRLARLEALAGRRAALLSAVMLRQNPHNVAEWHKRVKLFTGDPTKQVGKLRGVVVAVAAMAVDCKRAHWADVLRLEYNVCCVKLAKPMLHAASDLFKMV
jgi:hypothetical protein